MGVQMKKWVKVTLITLIGLIVIIPTIFVMVATKLVNDQNIPVSNTLFEKGQPKKMLIFWAHPDDEITSAGTISKLAKEKGSEIHTVYFTRGEKGPTNGLVSQDKLGERRTIEAEESGKLLGTDGVSFLDFPDSGLLATNEDEMKQAVRDKIKEFNPTIILTFDDVVGFYGHSDHMRVGKIIKEVLLEDRSKPGNTVQHMYQATLPEPLVNLALRLVVQFKEMYPKDGNGLPKPTVAIDMSDQYKEKSELLAVHATQVSIVNSVQPYHDKMPAWIYYHIFGKEYYTKVF